jgi:hypothetical protein
MPERAQPTNVPQQGYHAFSIEDLIDISAALLAVDPLLK